MARDAVAAALTVFGPQLVSAYLIGSLAHEGFVAAVSDIDIAVIVEGDDPGDPTRVAEISRRVLEQGPLAVGQMPVGVLVHRRRPAQRATARSACPRSTGWT